MYSEPLWTAFEMLHPECLAVLVAAQPEKAWSAQFLEELAKDRNGLPALIHPPETPVGWQQYANQFYVALCLDMGVMFSPYFPATAGSSSLWALLQQRAALAGLHRRLQGHLGGDSGGSEQGRIIESHAFTVCVVAKLPRMGRSKTRLAASMAQAGQPHAAAAAHFTHLFAQSSLLDCVEMYAQIPECTVLWALPGTEADAPGMATAAAALLAEAAAQPEAALVVSSHGVVAPNHLAGQTAQTLVADCSCSADILGAQCSLGSMLSVTCSHAAACRPAQPLVLLGMDAPHLPVQDVCRACALCRASGGAVLLPSTDGGFVAAVLPPAAVLAASHRCGTAAAAQQAPWRCGSLFDAVGLAGKWSTGEAAAAQAAALSSAGLQVHWQPPPAADGTDGTAAYIDIDTWDDLQAAAPHCTALQAPRVAALLGRLQQEGLRPLAPGDT